MKKNLRRFILSAIWAWACCLQLNATPGIGVSLINYTFDTVGFGYTITINARVTNFDTAPFSGTIDFGLRNQSQELSNAGIFNKPPYCSTVNPITLYGGETVAAIFSIDIDAQYFSPGPDVVVVWPICTQPITDSIEIPIIVQAPNALSGIGEELFGHLVVNGNIYLNAKGSNLNFKQVRIYNLMGQQVSNPLSGFVTEVPIPALPKGLYLCEFVTTDGRRKVVRFFN